MNVHLYQWIVVAWSYLWGSIPTGYWLMKFGRDIDIREYGSGNIGMTNVWRVAGPGWGITTLILDILKGVVAVWMAGWLNPTDGFTIALGGFFVILGNLFPVYLKFKGGKGVGTSIGVFYSLVPIPSLVGTVLFGLVIWRWKMVSLASLTGVTAMALTACALNGTDLAGSKLALLVSLLVWYGHRSNLLRLLAGQERKLGEPPSPQGTTPVKPTEGPPP